MILDDWSTFKEEEGYRNFQDPKGKELLEKCRDHVSKHLKSIKDVNSAVVLVHPFYLDIHHREELRLHPNLIAEADEYVSNVLKLLESPRDRSKISLIVLETPEDYFEKTSGLMERGTIDCVEFTQRMGGYPINYDYTSFFGFNYLFFGGLYNGLCFSQFIGGLGKRIPHERIHAIKKLVLDTRYESVDFRDFLYASHDKKRFRSTLIPEKIKGEVDSSEEVNLRLVSLEEILKEFE